MKQVDIDSELNPFFDATERFLIKLRTENDRLQFYEKYKHLYNSDDIKEIKLFIDYMIEVDYMCEFPRILITPKQEIIERLKHGLEFFENSVL